MERDRSSRAIAALVCALAAAAALGGTLQAQDERTSEYWAACRNGDVAKVREMLDAGMHVDTRFDAGMTPLAAAALRDQVAVAKLLVERGARLDLRDDSYQLTPLGYAIMFGQSKTVEFLLPRSTEDMDVALLFGVFRNQPALVERALQSKPTPPELA
ncbi:MAG: ankyrin repeat domain-containing protein, partial [Candidatus Acidiferrales bacterium]